MRYLRPIPRRLLPDDMLVWPAAGDGSFGEAVLVRHVRFERRESAVGYVAKYVTKAQSGGHGHIGGRWYWHGGQLAEPDVYTYDIPWDDVTDDCHIHNIPHIGARCKILDFYPGSDAGQILEGGYHEGTG